LCFHRRAERDVLVGDAKIAGSAQRRHRGTLLQHGSVLFCRSVAAPELEGIMELSSVWIDPREMAERWAERVARSLGFTLRRDVASARELEAAEQLRLAQFTAASWTNRR
jgi:lipoate-protein ligase A